MATHDATPPPGWYVDGPDGATWRWWDGAGWTEHAAPVHGPPEPSAQQPLAPGVTASTWAIRVIVVLPLVQLAASIPYYLEFAALFRSMSHPAAFPSGLLAAGAIMTLVSILVLAGYVVLAAVDHRALERRGIVRPFHWAWGFLGYVYLVGRVVVVHTRTGRGLGPLFGGIAVFLATNVATVLLVLTIIGRSFSELSQRAGS